MSTTSKLINLTTIALFSVTAIAQNPTDYVDPRIGSEGLGRVFIGPSTPFGMVKPSPDCTVNSNSGWLPMPSQVDGFSQTHVSGTGGGPKYGNILITPFVGNLEGTKHIDYRQEETIHLGYYSTTFTNSKIKTEITTSDRASLYRISYPQATTANLMIDAGFFLGEEDKPDGREAQNLVGSEIQIISSSEVCGYSRIRGGWNNGKAYTVYFYAITDKPSVEQKTWKNNSLSSQAYQFDSGEKTGALLSFGENAGELKIKIGISFVSILKARENALNEINGFDFEVTRQNLLNKWETLLSKIELSPDTPDKLKRMFYTGIYHTMIMPVDRSGENPSWTDPVPYYDDFYAIWDTYRTSSPLITIIDPKREADIVNSLINICKREGYMPDARSGNSNGRTQGGSNGEIVLADAIAKDLEGFDYNEALNAMLIDATMPPGGNQEAEGRGGLTEYLLYGYIPFGIDRAGNRTIEYSFCDWAIAQVGKRLGHDDIYNQYMRQSTYWKNLWRSEYEHAGVKGFIMPRDKDGNWLDDIPFGKSKNQHPTYRYTPVIFDGPWYTPWWSAFFYEATSWEYSLSVPHDVPGLIEICGGKEAFEKRLDTFFDKGFYNVNNEPSFLSPCLYHWLGKPHLTSDCVSSIISKNFNDTGMGLPGNDDSGAMSSWLAFHIMGLYPNAGHNYYLIHSPMVRQTKLNMASGKPFIISAPKLSEKNRYIIGAKLNGHDYPYASITHQQMMEGGELILEMGSKPGEWGELIIEN